jgi:predicted peroxiredoxin
VASAILALACAPSGRPAGLAEAGVVLFNVTSSPTDDPHAVTMALQLAGHALEDGRIVVLFFNVRAVSVPTNGLAEDLAFHAEPIKRLLADLITRGAEVHVCPHCMHALGVAPDDLVAGAVVTDREKLFARIGPNTVAFTY